MQGGTKYVTSEFQIRSTNDCTTNNQTKEKLTSVNNIGNIVVPNSTQQTDQTLDNRILKLSGRQL